MVTKGGQLDELRRDLRRVMRGLWHRRRPTDEFLEGIPRLHRLSRRHIAVLAQIGTEGERTVGELAQELDLSLPAVSKLTTELEKLSLVHRREHTDDRRRTVVDLNALTSDQVRAWLEQRDRPFVRTLSALTPDEREAFLKGLHTLADALMEESADGPFRSHHRAPHRRRPHRDRPV
jgi:DNA-binding MarR family transcriptional regulator